jgi:hypothetical protein
MLLVLIGRLQQLPHMVAFNNFIFYIVKYFPIPGKDAVKQLAHYLSTLAGSTLIILFIIFLNFLIIIT